MIDLWDLWYRPAALVFRDKKPVWNDTVFAYVMPNSNSSDEEVAAAIKSNLGANAGTVSIQRDFFINVVFFAVMREQKNMIALGLDKEPVAVNLADLKAELSLINQLSAILAYKRKAITLEQFAQEMKNEVLYFSTPFGEDDQGNNKLFLCSANESRTAYFPVFLSEKNLRTFCETVHRRGYVILKNSLQQILSGLDANERLQELVVVIEPQNQCNTAIPPMFRMTV